MKAPAYPVSETGGLDNAVGQRVRWLRRRRFSAEQLRGLVARAAAEIAEHRQRAIDYCRRYVAERPESISLQDQLAGDGALAAVREAIRDQGAYAFLLEEAEHGKVIAFPGASKQPATSGDGTSLDLSGLSPYVRRRIVAHAQAMAEKAKQRERDQ